MTLNSDPFELTERDLGNYGYARARDLAFDAVRRLWDLRQSQGMKQISLASKIGRDPGWVSRNLRGPGNWTLRTLGEFVVALGGRLEINIVPTETAIGLKENFHAYHEYESTPSNRITSKVTVWREDESQAKPAKTSNSAIWMAA